MLRPTQKTDKTYQTYPDGWGTSYAVTDRRVASVRQAVIHFAKTTVGERRYWDAYVGGVEIVRAVLVPYQSEIDQGDLFVINGTQYLVAQKDRKDTAPVSWLLSLKVPPVTYREVV